MHDLNQGAMPISEAVVALNGGARVKIKDVVPGKGLKGVNGNCISCFFPIQFMESTGISPKIQVSEILPMSLVPPNQFELSDCQKSSWTTLTFGTCLHRPSHLGFCGASAPFHSAPQNPWALQITWPRRKNLQCLLCTLHLSISNCIQHFERLKHEDHFPYLHIGCGAYKPPAPYPVLASSEETYGIGLSTSFW